MATPDLPAMSYALDSLFESSFSSFFHCCSTAVWFCCLAKMWSLPAYPSAFPLCLSLAFLFLTLRHRFYPRRQFFLLVPLLSGYVTFAEMWSLPALPSHLPAASFSCVPFPSSPPPALPFSDFLTLHDPLSVPLAVSQ